MIGVTKTAPTLFEVTPPQWACEKLADISEMLTLTVNFDGVCVVGGGRQVEGRQRGILGDICCKTGVLTNILMPLVVSQHLPGFSTFLCGCREYNGAFLAPERQLSTGHSNWGSL